MSLKINAFLIAATVLLLPAITSAQSAAVTPTLTLTADKTSVVANAGLSYNDLPTISWSSANATSCNAFGSGWSGSVPLAGSQKVNPSVTTSYLMICMGTGGSVVRSVTVSVTSSGGSNLQTASALNGLTQAMNTVAPKAQTQAGSGFTYTWNRNLQFGSPYTADVSALQTALTHEGVFSVGITGGFYKLTFAAVKKFQTKYGIPSTGFVGPQTRAELNALYGN